MRFRQIVWSPVETEYLKLHREDVPIMQLTIALAKSRNAIKRKCDELDGKVITKNMSKRSVIGRREDLDQFFRSNWEANFARYLNEKNKKWSYEPEIFSFLEHGVRRGTVSYCPDFKVGTLWVEVKGYLDKKGKTAIRRFAKYYPQEFKKLRAVVKSKNCVTAKFFEDLGIPIMAYYNELDKKYKNKIKNWE